MTGKTAAKAILVLGMHRSGTSAVTRVLNLLGVDLGEDLLLPAEDNTQGFWEHRGIVAIHEHLLAELGRSWQDIRSLPKGWLESAAARAARETLLQTLSHDFAAAPLWAVKDPRICRLLPLWLSLEDELHVQFHALHIVRHPEEVAGSLRVRNSMPPEQTRLLWLQYTMEAHTAARKLPRALLSFGELLADWKRGMEAVAKQLELAWPVLIEQAGPAIDDFLNPMERHHEVRSLHESPLPILVQRLYEACCPPVKDVSWAAIDSIVANCEEACGAMVPGFDLLKQKLDQMEVKLSGVDITAQDLQRKNEGLVYALGSLAARLPVQPIYHEQLADTAKLYYRQNGDVYDEERSVVSSWLVEDEYARLSFLLDSGARMDFLRFDPAERAAEFELIAIRIDGMRLNDLADRVRHVNQYKLPARDHLVRFGSWDGDPGVEVELNDVLKDGTVQTIEVECRRVSVAEELYQAAETRIFRHLAPLISSLEEFSATHSANARALQVLGESIGAGKHELQMALASLGQQLESEVREAHGANTQALRVLNESLEISRQELQQAVGGLRQQLEGEAERATTTQQTLQQRLDDLDRRYDAISERLHRGVFGFLRRKS